MQLGTLELWEGWLQTQQQVEHGESQGKKYPSTTNPPNSQTAMALRYTVKHLIVERGKFGNRAVAFIFRRRLQLVLPDRLG